MDALYEFIRLDMRRSFQFGRWDCLLRLGAWAEIVTGQDITGPWRDQCSTELGAMRILRREGGMVALIDKVFSPVGYVRTDKPQRGDIAAVGAPFGLTGAIVLAAVEGGEVLASVLHSGSVHVIRAPLVAAWTFS